MKKKESQREAIVTTLAGYVLKAGLAETSLRQLAGAADVSNRMLLYYFEDKSEIMRLVLLRVAEDLKQKVDAALGADAPDSPRDLFLALAEYSRSKALRPYMMVWIETVAAAGRGEQPHTEIAKTIAGGFLEWMETRLNAKDLETRKADAAMILAMVDGLTVLATCAPPGSIRAAQARMAENL